MSDQTPVVRDKPLRRLDSKAIFTASRQRILIEDVDVKAWGGVVSIRAMSATARDRFELTLAATRELGKPAPDNFRAFVIALTACDENGKLLFTDSVRIANEDKFLEDVSKVGELDPAGLDELLDVAIRVNALSPDEVKDLEGN